MRFSFSGYASLAAAFLLGVSAAPVYNTNSELELNARDYGNNIAEYVNLQRRTTYQDLTIKVHLGQHNKGASSEHWGIFFDCPGCTNVGPTYAVYAAAFVDAVAKAGKGGKGHDLVTPMSFEVRSNWDKSRKASEWLYTELGTVSVKKADNPKWKKYMDNWKAGGSLPVAPTAQGGNCADAAKTIVGKLVAEKFLASSAAFDTIYSAQYAGLKERTWDSFAKAAGGSAGKDKPTSGKPTDGKPTAKPPASKPASGKK